ncbi:MAG TPA: thioredoxin family protein [Acidiferrobacter sp.]|nr:thioredoxin family protein [Acidiferrobacter sp.]
MEVRLLVSKWCPVCPQAETVWSEVAKRHPMDYQVLDIADPAGRALVAGLRIRTVPALVVDGKLTAVGVQSLGDAIKIVDHAA